MDGVLPRWLRVWESNPPGSAHEAVEHTRCSYPHAERRRVELLRVSPNGFRDRGRRHLSAGLSMISAAATFPAAGVFRCGRAAWTRPGSNRPPPACKAGALPHMSYEPLALLRDDCRAYPEQESNLQHTGSEPAASSVGLPGRGCPAGEPTGRAFGFKRVSSERPAGIEPALSVWKTAVSAESTTTALATRRPCGVRTRNLSAENRASHQLAPTVHELTRPGPASRTRFLLIPNQAG